MFFNIHNQILNRELHIYLERELRVTGRSKIEAKHGVQWRPWVTSFSVPYTVITWHVNSKHDKTASGDWNWRTSALHSPPRRNAWLHSMTQRSLTEDLPNILLYQKISSPICCLKTLEWSTCQQLPNWIIFKTRLKTHLFKLAYYYLTL